MKIRALLLVITALSVVSAHAQETPRKVALNDGKMYFVYPYKMSVNTSYYDYEGNYTYNYYTGTERNIVPFPGSLPDGEYVMYYEPISRYKKKMWFFHRRGEYYYDTTTVAATFVIKNNQKNGMAQFYSSYSTEDITEEGSYQNDYREGIWKRFEWKSPVRFTYYLGEKYSADYSYQYDYMVEEFEFKEGIKNGTYKMYSQEHPEMVYATGFYKDNKTSGQWNHYYQNKQLSHSYFVSDSLGDPILNLGYSYNYGNNYGRSDYSVYNESYHGTNTYYFPNGQLLTRKKYKYGQLEQLDTGYYYDGKVNWSSYSYEEKKDTNTYFYIDHRTYDTLGRLMSHSLTQNGLSVFNKNYSEGKILSEYYSDPYYAHIENRDTLVITSATYYNEPQPGVPSSVTYKHLETGATFIRDADKNSGYMDTYSTMNDFNFRSDHSSHIYYVEEIDYRGKNGEYAVHSYKHYYRNPYYTFFTTYTSDEDSVVVKVNGKRFSGKFAEMQVTKYKKSGKVKLKNDKIKYYTYAYGGWDYGGNPSFGYRSKNFVAYDYGRYRRFRINLHRPLVNTFKGHYVDGVKQGEWTLRKKHSGSIISSSNYTNGNLNGLQMNYSFQYADRWSDCRDIYDKNIVKKQKLSRKWRYYLTDKSYYENNDLNGVSLSYHCNGRLAEKTEYKLGELDGIWETYDSDGNMTKKAFGREGWMDGPYQEWSFTRKLRYDCTFEEGALAGEYKYYYNNGKMQTTGVLSSGYKTGDWLTYFEDGQVKYKETYRLEDSTYYSFPAYSYVAYFKRPERYIHTMSTCYSMQYYPTGTLAAEGNIDRNNRKGLWKFYDEGGNLIKQITYESGTIIQTDERGKTDTLDHYGYYESFYSDGTKQSEAYVLSEITKYDCYQAVNISLQDLYYINFWDKSGTQTIKDKTGHLKTFHLTTGRPESEGEMINGKRTGYWRFWDPEGKLNEVGNYDKGLRTGKWLIGDLEGLHYLDDACFDITDPRVIEEMEYKQKQLSIHELFYKKGELIGENNYQVNLNNN